MSIQEQIQSYITSQPEPKRNDLLALDRIIREMEPDCKLWFLDGKNEQGKIVSNPSIGYGDLTLKYANGKTRDFYRIGISANTSGISVYVMGIDDKAYLSKTYAKAIGKASLTGYCIKFKSLSEIDTDVLRQVIRFGFENS